MRWAAASTGGSVLYRSREPSEIKPSYQYLTVVRYVNSTALRHTGTKMDFAFLSAVGPVLVLTVVSFLLAFIAEFSAPGETSSEALLND